MFPFVSANHEPADLLTADSLTQRVLHYDLETSLLKSLRFLTFPGGVNNDEHDGARGHVVRPYIRVVNREGYDEYSLHGIALFPEAILNHYEPFGETEGICWR